MYVHGIRCHDERIYEIKLFDRALSNGCNVVQTIGIELIDTFLNAKSNFECDLQRTFERMSTTIDDDNLTKNRNHINAISDNFATIVDNIWYTLIELETSLHERIMDSMNVFINTIHTIIQNFNDKCNETFNGIRSACDAYFQSNIDNVNKTIEEQRINHVSIINHKHDTMLCRANKWLSETIEGYEL